MSAFLLQLRTKTLVKMGTHRVYLEVIEKRSVLVLTAHNTPLPPVKS